MLMFDGDSGGMRRSHVRPVPLVPCSAFKGFRFPPEMIVLAVRWYLRFGLSYRDIEELLAERGIEVDHVTVYRWVQRFTPLLADAARPCRHAVGDRWCVDETYVKVAGRWRYVYRAIDQYGQIIDVYVSARRDTHAARRFFATAIGDHGEPAEVVTDRVGAGNSSDPLTWCFAFAVIAVVCLLRGSACGPFLSFRPARDRPVGVA
jgi:IS6 family transposase